MDAVGAEESVCGGECTLQTIGDVIRRQILERPAAGRRFDIDAQARRIIEENAARDLRSRILKIAPVPAGE
jgi:hypothetical protein